MQESTIFNDFAIVSVKGNNYRMHFGNMSKDEAINFRNVNLIEIYYV